MPLNKIIPVVVAFILGIIIGAGILYILNSRSLIPTKIEKASKLFASQIATIQGQVINQDGKGLNIKSTTGDEAYFPTSSKFSVYKKTSQELVASGSANIEDVDLNKEGNFVLELEEGEYRVTAAYFLKNQNSR